MHCCDIIMYFCILRLSQVYGAVERVVAGVVSGVEPSFLVDEQLGHSRVTAERRQMERRTTAAVDRIDFRTHIKQQRNDVMMATCRRAS